MDSSGVKQIQCPVANVSQGWIRERMLYLVCCRAARGLEVRERRALGWFQIKSMNQQCAAFFVSYGFSGSLRRIERVLLKIVSPHKERGMQFSSPGRVLVKLIKG